MAMVLSIVGVETLISLCVVWWLVKYPVIDGRTAAAAVDGAIAAPRSLPATRRRRPRGATTGAEVPTAAPPSVLTRRQGLFLLGLLGAVVVGLALSALITVAVLNALLMLVFVTAYSFKLVLIACAARAPARARPVPVDVPTDELPVYTVMLPVYREAAVLPQLVAAMQSLAYPSHLLDVKLLLESDDEETRRAAAQLELPEFVEVLAVPDIGPPGKARACNHGLAEARGEFIVIYDAEDCPEPDQLAAAVAAFRAQPPEVVCLQARLNFFNRDHNLLTRWFTAEYSVWFDQLLPGLAALDAPIPLGGTSNHFVTARLRQLGGWDVYNVTEDAELGMRIFMDGGRTAMLEATTYEEATSRYGNWLRQRSRWVKGYMQTYLRCMRHPIALWRDTGATGFGIFQLFFGANTLCLLLNPAYWALVVVWFAWRPAWVEGIFPAPVFYIALFGLLIGNVACMLAMVSGCYARRNYADVKWALLTPVYWLLMSVAAYKALAQLVYRPWHWEKTDHGFCSIDVAVAGSAVVAPPSGGSAPARPVAVRVASASTTPTRVQAPPPRLGAFVKRLARHDLAPVLAVATVAAIGATAWSLATHSLVLYGDAAAHLDVARRVTDGLREGLAQLGSVWLPLPHLLLVPFVAINLLWHTGLAGALVSGACFVYTAVRIYSIVRELSGGANRIGAWCAFAVAICNLNLLYVQTTALTEPVLLAFIVGAVFHLTRWCRTFAMSELVWAAALTTCATLTRYEGWALLAAESVAVIVWGRIADRRRHSSQANALVFALLGSYGVGLWFVYNLVIFGDPLYFLHSVYSAERINGAQAQFGLLGTKGHIGTTLLTFGWDVVGVVGPVPLIAAGVGLVLALAPSPGRQRQILVLGVLAAPVLFELAALYIGQITIRVPELAPHQLWNDRYALMALPLCAVAIGGAVGGSRLRATAALGAVAAGTVTMALATPITLADGRRGVSSATGGAPSVLASSIRHHYAGGEILADDLSASTVMFESGLDLARFVSPGFHPYWERALAAPARHVEWVLVYPGDAVADDMAAHPRRFADFRRVLVSGRATLYERRRPAPRKPPRSLAPARAIAPGDVEQLDPADVGWTARPTAAPPPRRDRLAGRAGTRLAVPSQVARPLAALPRAATLPRGRRHHRAAARAARHHRRRHTAARRGVAAEHRRSARARRRLRIARAARQLGAATARPLGTSRAADAGVRAGAAPSISKRASAASSAVVRWTAPRAQAVRAPARGGSRAAAARRGTDAADAEHPTRGAARAARSR